MKPFVLLLFLVFISACAPIRVDYDYEKTTDFDTYKTYNYYKEMDTGLSELDTKRFISSLNKTMQAKGLNLSDNPDFLINIKSQEYQDAQRSNVGVGVGGGGGNIGGGVSLGIPIGQANINRQITIEFVDENKTGLFWQAISQSSINPKATPEKRQTILQAVADKVLSQYPPIKK